MNHLVREISVLPGRILPFSWIKIPFRKKSVFPFYHLVTDEPAPHAGSLYPVVSVNRFHEDIGFLLHHFYPMTFDQVLNIASGNPLAGKLPGFFLTFDDGLREMAETVAPILSSRGIHAAFFVNPAFIGNREMFYRHKVSLLVSAIREHGNDLTNRHCAKLLECKPEELISRILSVGQNEIHILDLLAPCLEIDFDQFLREKKPYMELSQLRKLQDEGFIVGSHSQDHPLFSELPEEEMKKQLTASMEWLQNNLAISKRTFAFPFTDDRIPGSFFRWMIDVAKIDVSFGTAGFKTDGFVSHIQRIPMEKTGYRSARQIIGGEFSYSFVRSIFGKNKITRK
jgi:peptidoglycan/xylan/chitin deacetylase (PgdA/CDA1 family)